jgi:hypothetical protein
VLGLPVWEEDEDELDDAAVTDEPIVLPAGHEALAGASGRPSTVQSTPGAARPAAPTPPPTPPPTPRPRRDTTPPTGIPRVLPATPDELDLAGLVKSVDEADARHSKSGPSRDDSDQPEPPQP